MFHLGRWRCLQRLEGPECSACFEVDGAIVARLLGRRRDGGEQEGEKGRRVNWIHNVGCEYRGVAGGGPTPRKPSNGARCNLPPWSSAFAPSARGGMGQPCWEQKFSVVGSQRVVFRRLRRGPRSRARMHRPTHLTMKTNPNLVPLHESSSRRLDRLDLSAAVCESLHVQSHRPGLGQPEVREGGAFWHVDVLAGLELPAA